MNEICKDCAGCRACEHSCPHHAINMVENSEGFLYPQIDDSKCISCGLCEKICPQNKSSHDNRDLSLAYAAQIKEPNLLFKSTSGGFFAALALDILAVKGVVFGAEMDSGGYVHHTAVRNEDQLEAIQSSKYVISDTLDTYLQARNALKNGQTVLYSGCPCQIAGLKAFLRKDYDNLLTVDVICHGTPSFKLYDTYRKGLMEIYGAEIADYKFRDKSKHGWGSYWSYMVKGRKKAGGQHDDPYYSAFMDASANRESCYNCKYVGIENRPADITLGDYWGVDEFHSDMASNDGVSAVIVHTEKGKKWTDKALGRCRYVISDAAYIAKNNPSLRSSASRPDFRDHIYEGIDDKTPRQFVEENLKIPPSRILKTKVRLMMPYGLRVNIKKVKRAVKKH